MTLLGLEMLAERRTKTMKTINRDPFGRFDIVRETVRLDVHSREDCAWCGHAGRYFSDHRRLFRYGIWKDGIYTKPHLSEKLFCCVSCWRTYNT